VVPGIQTRNVAMARQWVERGMRFVGVAADYVLLMEKARETVAQLRAPR
jgi:2-keto-3-deoxy-L-rhamnonate aldolase RhmA